MRASPAPGCAHSKTHSVRLIAEALGGRDTWIVSSEQNARYGTHQGNLVSRSPARPSVALPWLAQRSDSAANDDAIPTGHSVPFNHSLHTWRDTPPAGHGCECLRTAECGLAWCRGFDGDDRLGQGTDMRCAVDCRYLRQKSGPVPAACLAGRH